MPREASRDMVGAGLPTPQFGAAACQRGQTRGFGSLEHARAFYGDFFTWYNHDHHHSYLAMLVWINKPVIATLRQGVSRVKINKSIVCVLLSMLPACTPVFLSPEARQLGNDESPTVVDSPTDEGYLRIIVSSNLDALKGDGFANVAKGYKYLAVNAVITVDNRSTEEIPLLLYDVEHNKRDLVSKLAIGGAQYVNTNSASQAKIELRVRAIPRTVASAYRDAFETIKGVLDSAHLLNEVASANPYAAAAGQLFKSIGEVAKSGNEESTSTLTAGLLLPTGIHETVPADGIPVVFFLERTDAGRANSLAISAPENLDRFKLCSNGGNELCELIDGKEVAYSDVPYLVITTAITPYRPARDWIGESLSCETANKGHDHILGLKERLRNQNLTDRQARLEQMTLDRLALLARAIEMPNGDSIKHDPAHSPDFVQIMHGWESMRAVLPGDLALWERFYSEQWNDIGACFESEMIRRGSEYQMVYYTVSRAFRAIDNLKKDENPGNDAVFSIIVDVQSPIRWLELKEGPLYSTLVKARTFAESFVYPEAEKLALQLEAATQEADRLQLKKTAEEWISKGCLSCNERLVRALTTVELDEASSKAAKLAVEVDKLRTELRDERQKITLLANIAAATDGTLVSTVDEAVNKSIELSAEATASAPELQEALTEMRELSASIQATLVESPTYADRRHLSD